MAINVKEVNPISLSNIERIEEAIDSKLREENSYNDYFNGHPDRKERHFYLIVVGNIASDEKIILKDRYAKAGWSRMEIVNSDENGERGGLIGIKLYPHG
jgi:hypothetical protein